MAAGQLIVPYSSPALTSTGLVAAGTVLQVFNTSTGTLATLYADVGLTTPIGNPLVANSAGRFTDQSTVIWANDAQAYDCFLNFPDGSNLSFNNLFVLEAQTNLSGYAPIASPHFTGVPTAPTPASNDNSGKLATTAFIYNQNFPPTENPHFTGVPTAPTPSNTSNDTTLATTAFVHLIAAGTSTLAPTSIYQKFESGLVIQTGQVVTPISNASYNLIFPTAFDTACTYVGIIINNTGMATSTVTGVATVSSFNTNGVSIQFIGFQSGAINSVSGYTWMAIGY